MVNFQFNREILQKASGSKLIIISANIQMQKSLDQAYPFKQDNNFWYLTGINEPSYILVLYGKDEFLIAPELSKAKETFDGAQDNKQLESVSGINQILNHKDGWDKVAKLLLTNKTLSTLIPGKTLFRHYGIYPNPAKKQLITKLKRLNPKVQLLDISPTLVGLRWVKTPSEIANIRKAVNITVDTLKEAFDPANLSSLTSAKQLEAVINFGFITRGANSIAFDPIIAQGKKATTIHYIKNDQTLNKKDLLIVDVGCEYGGYCSDISRTISLGKPTVRQQQIYDAVKEVQSEVIKIVKPGLTLTDLENTTLDLIGKQLIKLKLIKKLDKKEIRRYYPHAVSHSLGLDVHDPAYPKTPIKSGSVITVEPGIYISEESIGVRIEDDVLVKEFGSEVLSKGLSTSLSLQT